MSQAVCSVPGRQEDGVFIDPPTNLDRPVNRQRDLEACRSFNQSRVKEAQMRRQRQFVIEKLVEVLRKKMN